KNGFPFPGFGREKVFQFSSKLKKIFCVEKMREVTDQVSEIPLVSLLKYVSEEKVALLPFHALDTPLPQFLSERQKLGSLKCECVCVEEPILLFVEFFGLPRPFPQRIE